jgi:hypothetical protein
MVANSSGNVQLASGAAWSSALVFWPPAAVTGGLSVVPSVGGRYLSRAKAPHSSRGTPLVIQVKLTRTDRSLDVPIASTCPSLTSSIWT